VRLRAKRVGWWVPQPIASVKHQYFGDINDYRKYGLVRVLQERTQLSLGVWWMLTNDDGRTDGNFIDYLAQPTQWRGYDPVLFDALAAAVPRGRSLEHVGRLDLLPHSRFVGDPVPDSLAGREAAFTAARDALRSVDLAFLDPDNGIEVPSCRPGQRGSNKYVRWQELVDLYEDGGSLIVYQHFPREERQGYVERLADALMLRTRAPIVGCLRTANVAFFVIPQPQHRDAIVRAALSVEQAWKGQIAAWFPGPGPPERVGAI